MADRIIKSDSGNDVVIQNNGGTRKIEVTNSGDVEVTGDVKTTTVKATNLKANDGTASLEIADSTGDIGFSGNTNLKLKLPSAGGIFESDGSTEVLTESSGVATFKGTISADATKKARAFAAYASGAGSIGDATWSNFGAVGTWTERYDTHDNYNNTTGVFQPTKAGIYLLGYSISFGVIDSGEYIFSAMGKNWTSGDPTFEGYGWFRSFLGPSGGNIDATHNGSAIISLSTSDTVKPLCIHNDGASQNFEINRTQFWGIYLGET
jgi:hypothetical protein